MLKNKNGASLKALKLFIYLAAAALAGFLIWNFTARHPKSEPVSMEGGAAVSARAGAPGAPRKEPMQEEKAAKPLPPPPAEDITEEDRKALEKIIKEKGGQ